MLATPHLRNVSRQLLSRTQYRRARQAGTARFQKRADPDPRRLQLQLTATQSPTAQREREKGVHSDDRLPASSALVGQLFDHASISRQPTASHPPTKSLPVRMAPNRPNAAAVSSWRITRVPLSPPAAVQPSSATLPCRRMRLWVGGNHRRDDDKETPHPDNLLASAQSRPERGFRRVGCSEGGLRWAWRRGPEGEGDLQSHPCCHLLSR